MGCIGIAKPEEKNKRISSILKFPPKQKDLEKEIEIYYNKVYAWDLEHDRAFSLQQIMRTSPRKKRINHNPLSIKIVSNKTTNNPFGIIIQ